MGHITVVPPVYQPPPDRGGVVELQQVGRTVLPLLAQREGNLLGFVVVEEVEQTEERSEEADDGDDSGCGGEERNEDHEYFRSSLQVSFLNIDCLHVEGKTSFETPQD